MPDPVVADILESLRQLGGLRTTLGVEVSERAAQGRGLGDA